MTYQKTAWQDTLRNPQGEVIQQGTPLNAVIMNKIEDGIIEAERNANAELQKVNQTVAEISLTISDVAEDSDITQALNQAISKLASSKSAEIKIPSGTYYISSNLTFRNLRNVTISGSVNTKLKPTTGFSGGMVDIESCSHVTVENIEFDGDAKARFGIRVKDSNSTFITIRNCYIHNTYTAQASLGIGSGIAMYNVRNGLVDSCNFLNCGGDGVLLLGCRYVTVSNCRAERCLRHNYAFAEPISYHCTLRDSVGIDSYLSGIDMEAGRYCKVVNNYFANNGSYSNTLQNTDGLRSSIAMFSSSYNNLVSGNIIYNPKNYGIWCVQPTDAARTVDGSIQTVSDIIEGNVVRKAGIIGINLSGAANQLNPDNAYSVINNIIEDCPTAIRTNYTTKDSVIALNQIYRADRGIDCAISERLMIANNKIKDVRLYGIHMEYATQPSVTNNEINLLDATGNSRSVAIRINNFANSVQSANISGNSTNASNSKNQLMLQLVANAGLKNSQLINNIALDVDPPLVIEINTTSLTAHYNSRLEYGDYEFALYLQTEGSNSTAWRNKGFKSGATSRRPANSKVGAQYFDTTINKPIWFTGTIWVDVAGVPV